MITRVVVMGVLVVVLVLVQDHRPAVPLLGLRGLLQQSPRAARLPAVALYEAYLMPLGPKVVTLLSYS